MSSSTSTGIKKLQEEYIKLRKGGNLATIQGTVAPIKKNFKHWRGNICGPKNTPYSNGLYYFEIYFPEDYPNKGPIDVQMRTKTYHPNIDNYNGHICDSYFSNWNKENNVYGIVNAIHELLSNPNPQSAYNCLDVKKAAEFNLKYATINQEYNWDNSWNKGWDNTN